MKLIKTTLAVCLSLTLLNLTACKDNDQEIKEVHKALAQAEQADNGNNTSTNDSGTSNTTTTISGSQSTDNNTQATAPVDADISQQSDSYFSDAQKTLQDKLRKQPNTHKAKNVILMIADGNGINTNYATRLYMGQKQGGYGDEFVMTKEKLPYLALSKTYNTNAQTPDSSGTATAINTGIKTKSGVVGISSKARRGKCEDVANNTVTNFADVASKHGKSVGVVSTARLTHATPASVYAHSGDRDWENSVPKGCDQKDIAQQLIAKLHDSTVDIALGGGRNNFAKNSRSDKLDLLKTAQDQGVQVVNNLAELKKAKLDGITPTLGLFSSSHMSYEADRTDEEPSIVDMTESAINYLSKNKDGYYLMIEGGRVDHANHAGNASRALSDGEAFDKAVQKALAMTGDDTLVIVTADHGHSTTLNGYAGRGSNILGLTYKVDKLGTKHLDELEKGLDGKPYSIISYGNGLNSVLKKNADGSIAERQELTQEQATDKDYKQATLIPRIYESHSGSDVAIYAKGPWAHLFDGTVEQNYIFHVMNHAINNGD